MSEKYFIFGAAFNGDGSASTEAAGAIVTVTIATPGVLTWTAHGRAANSEIFLSTTGALPTGLAVGTRYFVRNPTANTFELSLTSGGASIATSGTQSGVHTATTVGAWNQANILTGTLPANGTLLAGDKVNIRSRTGNGANANISNVLAASITLGAGAGVATVAAPITWVLDDGAVWPGITGTLTYSTSSTTFTIAQRAFNRLISHTPHQWILTFSATAPASVAVTLLADTDGLRVNQPSRTAALQAGVISGTVTATHNNFYLSYNRGPTGGGVMILANQCEVRWVNPTIEIGTAVAGAVFGFTGFYGRNTLIGGRVFGAGATTGQALAGNVVSATNAHLLEAVGLQVPKAMALSQLLPTSGSRFSLFGLDGGSGGAVMAAWGTADSRNIDNFYPTLNASLPDSVSSGVSWRMYPQAATVNEHAMLTICKLFTGTPATKTVTLEFLLANPWGGGATTANSIWIDVSYIDDATGAPVSLSTRAENGAALTASTASWSATTWGPVGFDKKKISVTTPTAIRQDTAVTVAFCCSAASASANDILMICPDPQLT